MNFNKQKNIPYQKVSLIYLTSLTPVMYSCGKPTFLQVMDLTSQIIKNQNKPHKTNKTNKTDKSSKSQNPAISGLVLLGYIITHVWALFVLNFVSYHFLTKQPWQCPFNLFPATRRDFTVNLFPSLSISGPCSFFAKSCVPNFRISFSVHLDGLIDGPASPVTLLTSCACRSSLWVNKQVSGVRRMWLCRIFCASRLLFHHQITWSISDGQSLGLDVA